MSTPQSVYDLIEYSSQTGWSCDSPSPNLVGVKALGIAMIPAAWRPEFFVVPSTAYAHWRSLDVSARAKFLDELAPLIVERCQAWPNDVALGMVLRSSASSESLRARGAFSSKKLAADFDAAQVAEALGNIFQQTSTANSETDLAIVVQPFVGDTNYGHLSNERRISKTINQWEWEQATPVANGRVNSQRATPLTNSILVANNQKALVARFRDVGRWTTELNKGPAHLEWVLGNNRLWIVQLDFENDAPDEGVDPNVNFRPADVQSPGDLPLGSSLTLVDLAQNKYPWKKVENVRTFQNARTDPFPKLFMLPGPALKKTPPSTLKAEIETISQGRVVCRTDCNSAAVSGLNLPRTHTVSSSTALKEMYKYLAALEQKGATAEEVCFVLHKFIPAKACAWAHADPNSQFVQVDSLWGVPDGLQYLPHDSFEYDVKLKSETGGGRLRYKPRFIQETSDGSWQELRVRRSLARHRSLQARDVAEVATVSHKMASSIGQATLIMWFCGIPSDLGIGANLPWFRMPARDTAARKPTAAPQWPRRSIRSDHDLAQLAKELPKREILALEPEVDFIRKDEAFLKEVIRLSRELNLPVELAGSTLSHAYYQLEESGVSVILKDENKWTRVLRKQSFDKLVRDKIPTRIEGGGEVVVQTSLPRSELRRALVAKLFEEGLELLAARDPEEVREELADLLEVIRALASTTGVDWEDVEKAAHKKRDDRGGFEHGAVLIETSRPSPRRSRSGSNRGYTPAHLSRIESGDHDATASFGALVNRGTHGVRLSIGQSRFTVRFERDSIQIVADEGSPPSSYVDSEEQLALPLPNNSSRNTKK